jgi:predicted GIY-YIG superfamily endonuclease
MKQRRKTQRPAKKKKRTGWWVYILECGGGRLYTGSTNNVERRLKAHREGKGARFTRSFGVKRLLYRERCGTINAALRREAAIKRLTKRRKLQLVGKPSSQLSA